ncbi:type II secretion system F family protein [Proteiniclasticum sp. SCR006]|uniref:Type II secretion system F family protein n=1 Tax=Proteiniclasticum aestuarii TaxID=2817862 RepID=A0A939KKD4_9CLOT|nr:type II secretion system F family protein [Proteiniclasticum aestuarii]MBO1265981.1 type II secretion system F family protein [Proteiniclasticum aestuarii]
MKYLIILGAFFFSLFSFLSLYLILFSGRLRLRGRLQGIQSMKKDFEEELIEEYAPKDKEKKSVSAMLRKLLPLEKYLEKKRRKLMQASILLKAEEFLFITFMVSLILGLLVYLFSGMILISILTFFIGFRLSDSYILSVKRSRSQKLNDQLPDALGAISNSLRSGLSFIQSMNIAMKEMESPIADEFARVIRDNTLGKPLDEALSDLAERNDDEDIDMLVTAIMIQRQVGGNLSEVLDVITGTIRERMRIKGEVRTLTAQGKMSAAVIGLLPVGIALAISVMNPEYIHVLLNTTLGNILIGVAVMMEMTGTFILTRIIKIEV